MLKSSSGLSAVVAAIGATAFGLSGAFASPAGGSVIAGSANIDTLEGEEVIGVTQTSNSAIIEWQSFDISSGDNFYFDQPSANAVTLNRVLGTGVSTIDGEITANGNIFIINGDGVLFGENSIVDVNGLLATTTDIDNADFMAGDYNFQFPGSPTGSVINRGDISSKNAGIIAFVAPNVANEGVIAARLGTVSLAAGERYMLDFFGDGLVAFAGGGVADDITAEVSVTGEINAEDGAIYLSATNALAFIETVINVEADLIARSATQEGGKIILSGGDNSTINISDATLDVSGYDGGEISITGGFINVFDTASLIADGLEPTAPPLTWVFENAGFGGADSGTPLTGSFGYDADTGVFSDIMVTSGPGATLPGADYLATGPSTAPNLIDFLSTTESDFTNAFRLRLGFSGPLTNAGGTLNIAFGYEARCLDTSCNFPGFGPDARGLIGPTSITATPIPLIGDENGGDIFVVSSIQTDFAGMASVAPGLSTGTGGTITIGSDDVLIFNGMTNIGETPREGTLTLFGDPPPPPPDDMEEEIDDAVTETISEINATTTQSQTGEGQETEEGGSSAPQADAVFEDTSFFDTETEAGNETEDRRLLCLLGVAEAACAKR